MFEPTSHRPRLSALPRICVCERLMQVDVASQSTLQADGSEGSARQSGPTRVRVQIEARAGSLQTHELSEAARTGNANLIGRVVARVRCSGAEPAEAQRRCSEARLRVTEEPSGVVRVFCDFPPVGPAYVETDAIAALDGVSMDAWIASDRIGHLSARTSGGDLVHGAMTRGMLELETEGGRLDIGCHVGDLRALNHGGRVLIHRIAGRAEVRSRQGDVVIRTASNTVPWDRDHHGLAPIAACADEGDVELDLRSGWRSAGRVLAFDGEAGSSSGRSLRLAAGGSEAVLVAPRGRVSVSPRPWS